MDGILASLDSAFWITVAAIAGLLVLSGFFSGSETALTAASRGKLRAQADRGSRGAQTALGLTDDGERLIGSVLLGNNLVNILAASLATALFTRLFGESGVALATLVMTLLVLIFAEVLPKTYAITNPEHAAARVARPIRVLVLVLSPVVAAVQTLVRAMLRLVGVRADPGSRVLSVRDEIAGAIRLGHHEGTVEKDDRDRILGALDLSDRTVEEIMRHRSQIVMIDAAAPPAEILAQVVASSHTRLPVFHGHPENIVGVLHIRDVLHEVERLLRDAGPRDGPAHPGNGAAQAPGRPDATEVPPGPADDAGEAGAAGDAGETAGRMIDLGLLNVLDIARPPYFVPDTTPLDEQMRQFLQQRRHFALVVDEYGALRGLITLEDILEEIVGEIEDEFDIHAETEPIRLAGGDYLVDGATTIRDLNRSTDWNLPDDEANTIAGLVIHEAQTIPAEGQVFSFHGFRFEIAQREGNRITQLRIRPE